MMRIEEVRRGLGWSQARLAREAGMSASSVSAIERGRLVPYPAQVEKLARAVGWDGEASELFAHAAIVA